MSEMDIHEVMKHLPHRYPFLLVDKVLDFVPGESLRAVKNVTINEPFFQGHFPHIPVMPGVLIMEALAQATGILSFKTTGNLPSDNSLYYFVGIDKARFRKPVEPGDQLILEVTLERRIRDVWKFTGKALVDGEVVASANLMCAEKELD
ncbi:MAG: 3-hydroxyacyl-ACP dehydratase FabZ [Gammaproteobacteria bacterium]|jgi:3-hydroxyacyl-[acyl-carrier-protein] dehydratase|nr:3-hydroxyacyl-ACP dehydratase FabZ [Gammaproteobacteria bacterium]MBT3967676.1 3-hydroxyacyl-ACP dehydratase FabZ [Gammaproteobacteria bacterium]MBT4330631.1 3-hydroxyacyl-ACP dehydratase FabZ [Gammaproteobacteria bacterium]MBT5635323.1 3-hydroxyacyl-ACP dehydratase FabZ [Gammaproteobacteria bacterium]MBT7023474.1 3-hydroxyacyl-ACP dehydratase FabZ [Gammaproteobacteria bacterium]